jgi:hypothetical protein
MTLSLQEGGAKKLISRRNSKPRQHSPTLDVEETTLRSHMKRGCRATKFQFLRDFGSKDVIGHKQTQNALFRHQFDYLGR